MRYVIYSRSVAPVAFGAKIPNNLCSPSVSSLLNRLGLRTYGLNCESSSSLGLEQQE